MRERTTARHRLLAVLMVAALMFAEADAAPFAYVISPGLAGRIAVIDTATRTLLPTTFDTGGNGASGATLTASGDRLFVINAFQRGATFGPGSLSIIDPATGTLLANVGLQGSGHFALTPDGNTVVTSDSNASTLTLIDVASKRVTSTVKLNDAVLRSIAISSDGQIAYVAADDLIAFSLQSLKVVGRVTFPIREMYGTGIVISRDGKIVYVLTDSGIAKGTLFAISTEDLSILGSVELGDYSTNVAVSPDGRRVYVVNYIRHTLTIVDASSMAITKQLTVAKQPLGVTVTPDGRYVYVTGSDPYAVDVIDASNDTIIDTIPSVGGPAGNQFIPTGPKNGLTLIREFYNAKLDHYFMTSNVVEIVDLENGVHPGWTRTGEKFSMFASKLSVGMGSPVCRFYGAPQGGGDTHFYSASSSECDVVAKPPFAPAWVKESDNVFEAILPNLVTGACPIGTVGVYRLWNQRVDSYHRYTTNPTIKAQMVAKGYVGEGYGSDGVAMCTALEN